MVMVIHVISCHSIIHLKAAQGGARKQIRSAPPVVSSIRDAACFAGARGYQYQGYHVPRTYHVHVSPSLKLLTHANHQPISQIGSSSQAVLVK